MRSALATLALAVCLLLAGTGHAATFTVDSLDDGHDAVPGDGVCAGPEGACTLRAAIEEANAFPGLDTIQLPSGEFVWSSGLPSSLSITDSLEVIGSGRESTILRSFDLDMPPPSGVNATLLVRDLAIVDSLSSRAAVRLGASVIIGTFERVRIANGNGRGADCGSEGARCSFSEVLIEGNAGDGINSYGTAEIHHSILQGNGGFGAHVHEDGVYVYDSIVRANVAGGVTSSDDPALVVRSLIEDNLGPGLLGVPVGNVLGIDFVIDSIVRGNKDGGIHANVAYVFRSTIHDNESAGCGGGIFASSGGVVMASTVSGNTAPEGGGICLRNGHPDPQLLLILGSTVAENQATTGGGILVDCTPQLCDYPAAFQESIIARNHRSEEHTSELPVPPPNLSNPLQVESRGYNLLGDGTGCFFTPAAGDQIGTTASPIDPLLTPLGQHGGPTPTHGISYWSPARDAIPPGQCDATQFDFLDHGLGGVEPITHDTDQRGVPRPQGFGCEIGAVELEDPPHVPAMGPSALGLLIVAFLATATGMRSSSASSSARASRRRRA